MTTSIDINRQRRRDGAFFEDWSEYGLGPMDGEPDEWPRAAPSTVRMDTGARIVSGHRAPIKAPRYPKYYCSLHRRIECLGNQPGFELRLPTHETIASAVRIRRAIKTIPGVTRHPSLARHDRVTSAYYADKWYVPAEEWQALRKVLPAVKAAVREWVEQHR